MSDNLTNQSQPQQQQLTQQEQIAFLYNQQTNLTRLIEQLNENFITLRSENINRNNTLQNEPNVPSPTVAVKAKSNFKFTKPSMYDGERKARTLDNWIYSVNQYCRNYGLEDAEAIDVAVSFLEGTALQFWRMYEKDDGYLSIRDLNDFFSAIRNKFFPVDYVRNLREKLSRLKQKTSVSQYNQVFDETLFQLPSDEYTEKDMLFNYISGLKPEVKIQVSISKPKNLTDAQATAELCDDVIFNARKNTSENSKNNRPQTRRRYEPMDVDNIEHEKPDGKSYKGYKKNNSRNSNSDNYNSNRSIECYNCGKRGHIARECWSKKNDNNNNYGKRTNNTNNIEEEDNSNDESNTESSHDSSSEDEQRSQRPGPSSGRHRRPQRK